MDGQEKWIEAGPWRNRSDQASIDRIGARSLPNLGIAGAAVAFFVHVLQWVLLPFVLAALLACLCTPAVDWVTRKSHLPRVLSGAVVLLVLLAAAAGAGYRLVPPLIGEIKEVAVDFTGIVDNLARDAIGRQVVTLFGRPMTASALAQAIVADIEATMAQPGRLFVVGCLGAGSVFGTILTTVLLFYFVLTGPDILRALLWLVPPGQRPLALRVWQHFHPALKRYLFGVVIVIAYTAVAAYAGLGLFLGIHHAVLLALLTGILELIPVAGPLASAVIAGLIAIRHASGIGPVVSYAIYATVLRLSIDQLLGPIVLGVQVRVHPVLIIFGIMGGGVLFGLTGVLIAVPALLAVKSVLTVRYGEVESGAAAASHRPAFAPRVAAAVPAPIRGSRREDIGASQASGRAPE